MGLFDEGQGAFIEDHSRQGNNATAINFDDTTSWQPSPFGKSLTFAGSVDQYVNIPKHFWRDNPQEYAISFWMSLSSNVAATRCAFTYTNTGGSPHSFMQFTVHTLRMTMSCSDGSTTPSVLTTAGYFAVNRYYHIVGVRDAANIHLYVDGVLIGSTAHTLGTITVTATPKIGISPTLNTQDWLGTINDFRAFRRVLSPYEVKELFEQPYEMFNRQYAPIFAFGTTAAGGLVKNRNGLGIASLSKLNGLAMASVKNINGLTNI